MACGIVDIPGFPHFLMASIYMMVGSGLSTFNLGMLSSLAAQAEAWQLPFFIAGDFKNGPSLLVQSCFPFRSSSKVLAPKKPTCITSMSSSVIGFAIASSLLADAVELIEVIYSSGLATHRPVAFQLVQAPRQLTCLVIRKHQKFPPSKTWAP